MAVYLDESNFFKFVIISDNPKPSTRNITEKPPKDREQKDNNMSTGSSSPPPNNEKLDEKNQNSQESTKLPEVKVDDIPNNNGDSTKEQKNEIEEKSSRLTIEVPLKNASPLLVTSPSDIRAKTPEPTSPIPSPNSSIFKNVSKKLGNFMKSSENGTTPDQEEVTTVTTVTTSDSKDQLQQVQEVQQVPQVQEVVNKIVAHDITKDIVNTARSIDENKKEDEVKKNTPEPIGAKQRTGSLPNLVNMKMFITRTSSLLVDKLKKEFDNLDRRMYPDMEPEWVEENQNKPNESNKSSRDAAISEREQLLGNKDVEITNGESQKPQSTQNIMSEIGDALNERKEKLDNLGEKTEELSSHATGFAELAAQIRKDQEQKSKSWFW